MHRVARDGTRVPLQARQPPHLKPKTLIVPNSLRRELRPIFTHRFKTPATQSGGNITYNNNGRLLEVVSYKEAERYVYEYLKKHDNKNWQWSRLNRRDNPMRTEGGVAFSEVDFYRWFSGSGWRAADAKLLSTREDWTFKLSTAQWRYLRLHQGYIYLFKWTPVPYKPKGGTEHNSLRTGYEIYRLNLADVRWIMRRMQRAEGAV